MSLNRLVRVSLDNQDLQGHIAKALGQGFALPKKTAVRAGGEFVSLGKPVKIRRGPRHCNWVRKRQQATDEKSITSGPQGPYACERRWLSRREGAASRTIQQARRPARTVRFRPPRG